jgi:hypothetical protein
MSLIKFCLFLEIEIFKILVDYLIEKNRFLKILFPNKNFASSLYFLNAK